jgi:hypothetical protein
VGLSGVEWDVKRCSCSEVVHELASAQNRSGVAVMKSKVVNLT